MTRAMHEDDYQVIFAEAERNTRHLLTSQGRVYDGRIEDLISDALRLTAFQLDADLLLRVTMTDLRDVVMSAVIEADVLHNRARA